MWRSAKHPQNVLNMCQNRHLLPSFRPSFVMLAPMEFPRASFIPKCGLVLRLTASHPFSFPSTFLCAAEFFSSVFHFHRSVVPRNNLDRIHIHHRDSTIKSFIMNSTFTLASPLSGQHLPPRFIISFRFPVSTQHLNCSLQKSDRPTNLSIICTAHARQALLKD
jgi:hypothetical protein